MNSENKYQKKEELVVIDSKNKSRGIGKNKNIILKVKAKDLPDGVDKDDLVAAFKVNAEEKKDENSKFKAKYLIPIVLPLVLIGAVKGCSEVKTANDIVVDVPTQKTIIEEINSQYYDIDSPYMFMEGIVNASGQEGMTANYVNEDYVLNGEYYNSDKQFEYEQRASSGQDKFEQMEKEVDENLEILTNSESTQNEKAEAARKLLEINQTIEKIYQDNLEFIESQAESFENSSKAFEDSNTESEIKVIRETIDEYKENLGLTTENIANMGQIVKLTQDGYSISISDQENKRGDYTISGDAVKVVAEQVGFDEKIEKIFNDFVQNKEQSRDGKDIEEANNER